MHDFGANVERMRFKEPDRFDKADLWSGVDAKVRKDRKDRRKEENRFCGEWILVGYEYGERENDGDMTIRSPYYLTEENGVNSKLLIYSGDDQLPL